MVGVGAVLASEPTATQTPITLALPEQPDKSQPSDSPRERSTRGAGPEQAASDQGAVYTWEDGDRTLRVALQDDLVVQKTAANAPDDVMVVKTASDSIFRKQVKHAQDARPVFRSESGGGLMTLPGGVLLALYPEWDQGTVDSFFLRNGISTDRTSVLGFIPNSFLVETDPGFPSLELANALAGQDGVLISSPNWWREVGTTMNDDHGDSFGTATPLSLGSSVAGRIDRSDDVDAFRLDLSDASGDTDVWVYTTGYLNTYGELLHSTGSPLVSNDDSRIMGRYYSFGLRSILPPGVYYVTVTTPDTATGDYLLHAEAVSDPGSTTDAATPLNLDSPTPGTIYPASDEDYFRLDFTEPTSLIIYARSDDWSVFGDLLDSGGNDISENLFQPFLEFVMHEDFGPGTYYIRVTTSEATTAAHYTIHAVEDTAYTDFIRECEAKTRLLMKTPQIRDSLYGCQWHLDNRDGEDINIEPVWAEGIKGEGINVAVVDDGMYFLHEDLRDNVDASRNHDYSGSGSINHPFMHHGTYAAGVIAARDNTIGVRGVAPRATIYGYNLLSERNQTLYAEADAMARERLVTAVSNNSWGPYEDAALWLAPAFWQMAVNAGLQDGYYGKGTFYAFSGGNGDMQGGHSNLNELANYYGVTAVCAVNDLDVRSYYSEWGANLWVCAPSSGLGRGIATTENSDRYIRSFGGTSAATPVVSGIAALMRSANSDLTWRDLKLILAASARKNDAGNPGWEDGARKYGSDSDTDRYHFNHEYGFGVVDAKAAVDLAKEWTNVPPLLSSSVTSGSLIKEIPDAPLVGDPITIAHRLTLGTGIEFIEFAEVVVSFQHRSFRDLDIELVSPSGVVSKLSESYDTYPIVLDGEFRFGSARHLGEDPSGEWELRVTDRVQAVGGTLDSWTVTVYGHGHTPGSPTVTSVTPGTGSLTVTWAAPSKTGNSAVKAYDLRYIQTSAEETLDSDWTVVEDVWTSPSGGNLEFTVFELAGGTRYDVQVRAVNETGAGPWSDTFTGPPTQMATGACTAGGAVPDAANNPELVSDCSTLLSARHELGGSTTLNWSAITPISDWNGVTLGGSPQRVTELNLDNYSQFKSIPTALGDLESLQVLSLVGNQLTGSIPTELGSLSNLQVLDLSENDLSGPIPMELNGLSSLQVLNLSRNQLTGPIPATLGDLDNLQELVLNDNRLTGEIPLEMGNLSNLIVLDFYFNRLTGSIPPGLDSLGNLRVLDLGINQLTGQIPKELGSLTNLRELNLWGSQQFTGEIPVELSNLSYLRELYIASNYLTGEIPSELGNLTNLQRLYIGGDGLTGGIPLELGNISTLITLFLSGKGLTGEIPSELGNLTNLQYLYLSHTQLMGPIPVELGSLSNLRRLSLTGSQLTGPIPSELGNLTNLLGLILSWNQLTGLIPAELGNLSNLEELHLSQNELTGPIPEELGNLSSLQELYLGNQLTGCIPQGLRVVDDTDVFGLGLPFCDVLLSGLTISPGSLIPPFDPDRTDYAAVVGQSQITVTSTNEHNATSQILDEDRNYIRDANNSLVGHQIDLNADVTTISIRVTSQDGLATHNYTILVTLASAPGTPAISGIIPGEGSLTASWAPPRETGGADIASYDLRHIESGESDKSSANWSVVDDAWSSGPLRYTIVGLKGGTPYDVQVRAVHGAGAGPWSETVVGTPEELSVCVTEGAVADADNNPGLVSDCEALLEARDVLAVSVTLNWSAGTPIGEWEGVTLRGTPARVRYLDLRDRGLGGSIPTELGRLSSLTYLNLRRNDLTGPIPTELDSLTNLRVLNLHSNELSGTIPDLSSMTRLEQLYLANNSLNGGLPEWLGGMARVKELWLWGNELEGSIPDLSGMTALDRLKLQDNQLTGGVPAWFGNMTNLRYLYLHRNLLDGEIPAELGGMTKLRYVWLHSNKLTGEIPAELGDLDSLWDLNLHSNALEGSIPAELSRLSSLTHLRLHRNRLSGPMPSELGNLSSLKFMWLHGNQLTGEIPSELSGLARLQRLYLSENQLSGDMPAELDNLADSLTHWRLAGNRFTGCVPARLAAVPDNDLDDLGLEVCGKP